MNNFKTKTSAASFGETTAASDGFRIGRIVSVIDNRFMVDYPGNPLGPIAARATKSAKDQLSGTANLAGKEVLLAFENSNSGMPIILDTMYSLLDEVAEATMVEPEMSSGTDVIVDGKRITFEASDEIELKCGKASIVLTSAGKVIIKGACLISHSTGENRIRGASVAIN